MIELRADGVVVQHLFVGRTHNLAELALRQRIPLIADQPSFARASGLAAYASTGAGPFAGWRIISMPAGAAAPSAEGRCGAFRGAGSCRPEW
jgi:hypothetical protein